MNTFTKLLFALLFFATCPLAQAAESDALTTTDYGTLYMLEKRETQVKPWQVGLDYGAQFNNPYLNVQAVTLAAQRNLNAFFSAGVQTSRYFASETTVVSAVEKTLAAQNISQTVQKPVASYYATASVMPLSGRLNLFSYTSVAFDFLVTLGTGAVQHSSGGTNFSTLWLVSPRAMLTPNLGLDISVGQQIEAPLSTDRISNFEGRVGTFVRF